jgi:hypothetical protein
MKIRQFIAVGIFVLCFGITSAQAQRMPSGGGVVGGGSSGQGAGGGGASAGGSGGGAAAIPGVTHHPLWNPPPNVSAKNDGAFEPTSFQSYDEAVASGKAATATREPSIAEIAKMTQEQRATVPRARILVEQDADGKLQEIKETP